MRTLARRAVPLVLAGLLLVSTAAAASPTSTPTWTQTRQRLPVDRVGVQSDHAAASAVDCVTAAYCAVVGSYDTDDPSLPRRAFLDIEANGTASSIAAPLPANADGRFAPYFEDVSCPAVDQCVAVGRYATRSGDRPLIETQSGRQWVPRTVGTRILDHVACTTTVCAASSSDDIGDGVFTVRSANGHWRIPDIAAPAGMDILWIDDVSCAASTCYAIGTAAPKHSGPEQSVVVLPDGADYRAVLAAQPTGVTDPVRLGALACPNATTCYMTGQAPVSDANHLIIETLAGQQLTAIEPRLPKAASSDPPLGAGRIACAVNGFCAATAEYGPSQPEYEIDGDGDLLLTRHGSTWRAVVAPVPGDQSLSSLTLTGLSCASASCTVVGEIGSHAARRAFAETYAAGVWTPQVLPVATWIPHSPSGTATVLGAVDCADDGCLATGIFEGYSGTTAVDLGALLARD